MTVVAAPEESTFDLTRLVDELRAAGFRVDARQFLSAAELLLECARLEIDVTGDPERLRTFLAPVFCSSPEEQALFGDIVAGRNLPRDDAPQGTDPPEPFATWRRARWTLPLVVALIGGLALAGRIVHRHHHQAARVAAAKTLGVDGLALPDDGAAATARDPAAAEGYRVHRLATVKPDCPRAVAVPRRHIRWARALFESLACVAGAFALWWLVTRTRRVLVLQRLPVEARADFATLPQNDSTLPPLDELALRRTTSLLRRPREQAVMMVEIKASVEAAARGAGLALPLYAARRAIPEYLALVEDLGGRDHQARLYHDVLDGLEQQGLTVSRYTFAGDPRACFDRGAPGKPRLLGEVLTRHHRATLLLFVDAARCFSPVSARPEPWVDRLRACERRALLTPLPPGEWTRQEWQLGELGFVVLPAGQGDDGLRAYGEIDADADWKIDRLFPAPYARPYPSLLRSRPALALDRDAPPSAVTGKLIRQLKHYLGPTGFTWLAACAAYPEIDWPLTLHLSAVIGPAAPAPAGPTKDRAMAAPQRRAADNGTSDGTRDRTRVTLAALARLPCFRAGFMPEWLRTTLLSQLSHEQEVAVRQCLARRLEELARRALTRQAGESTGPGLRIGAWVAPLDLPRTAAAGDPMRDAVFVGYMAGAHIPAPAVLAPTLLRQLFRRIGRLPAPAGGVAQRAPRTAAQRIAARAHALTAMRPTLGGAALSLLAGALAFPALALLHSSTAPSAREPPPFGFALAPTGNRVLTACGGRAQLWDRNGKAVGELVPPRDEVLTAPLYSPDGKYVTISAQSGRSWIWYQEKREPAQGYVGRKVVFDASGGRYAILAGRRVELWVPSDEPGTVSQRGWLDADGDVADVGFGPDGTHVFTVTVDGHVRVWDTSSFNAIGDSIAAPPDAVARGQSVADFSPDGKTIAVAQPGNGTLGIWEVATMSGPRRLKVRTDYGLAVAAVKFIPGGKRIAAMLLNGDVSLMSLAGGPSIELAAPEGPAASTLGFSQDGRLLLTSTQPAASAGPGGAWIWNVATGSMIAALFSGPGPASAALDSAGNTVAVGTGGAVLFFGVDAPIPAEPPTPAVPEGGSEAPPEKSDADTLMKRAREALLKQDCLSAIPLSRSALKDRPGLSAAYQIIAVCSCRLIDAEGAKRAFARVEARARPMVASQCRKNGIDLGLKDDPGDVVATPAPPDDDNLKLARYHFQRGSNLFDLGKYPDAVKEYEQAYVITRDPTILFNLAQAHRLAGDGKEAMRLYETYLGYVPNSPYRDSIKETMAALGKKLPSVAAPPPQVTVPAPNDTAPSRGNTPPNPSK